MGNKFRIISLNTIGRDGVHSNLNFFDEDKFKIDSSSVVKTLIIGANGTGKSRFLKLITEVFKAVYEFSKGLSLTKYKNLNTIMDENNLASLNLKYEIEDRMKKRIVEIEIKQNHELNSEHSKNSTFSMNVNNRKVVKQITVMNHVPNKLIAISFMLHDVFPFSTFEINNDSFYNYCGILRASNNSFLNTVQDRLCELILLNSQNQKFCNGMSKVMKFIGLNDMCRVKYQQRNMSFFDYRSYTELVDNLKKRRDDYMKGDTSGFRSERLNRMDNNTIVELANYIENNVNKFKSSEISYFIDFNEEENENYFNVIEVMNNLNSLRLIGSVSLDLYSQNEFTFMNASSGQKQIMYTFACILSKIEDTNLIMIDEPELSLHPNWQIKYVDLLDNIFHDYVGSHFLMATHSHFMASDLKENSSIVSFKQDQNNIITKNVLKYDTYYRSVDEILYEVFDIATTRNYYVATKLDQIMEKYIKGEDIIISEIDEMKSILKQLRDQDPMKIAIKKLLNDINEVAL